MRLVNDTDEYINVMNFITLMQSCPTSITHVKVDRVILMNLIERLEILEARLRIEK